MPFQLAQLNRPTQTLVELFDKDETGEFFPIELRIQHYRLTPELMNELAEIRTDTRVESYISAQMQRLNDELAEKQKTGEAVSDAEARELAEAAKIKLPRSVLVLSLARVLTYTDIEGEGGEIVPPTEEGLDRVPHNILQAMYEALFESAVPKKTNLTTSLNGTPGAGGGARR